MFHRINPEKELLYIGEDFSFINHQSLFLKEKPSYFLKYLIFYVELISVFVMPQRPKDCVLIWV